MTGSDLRDAMKMKREEISEEAVIKIKEKMKAEGEEKLKMKKGIKEEVVGLL